LVRYDNGYLTTRMSFSYTVGNVRYAFSRLRELLARANALRSGDMLAGVAAQSAEERAPAQFALADASPNRFLAEHVIAYEAEEVTRLIGATHAAEAFAPIRSFTVGEVRDWLLSGQATGERIAAVAPELTPEIVAAVIKTMRVQDLILAAVKMRLLTRFRTTLGRQGGQP
jgi:ethanolamine ammonia-lyase large subunit